jgi:splicing factor 1
MTKTRPAKIVSFYLYCSEHHMLTYQTGGQIGHRKYDCPERQNFTANIICRICGNAGHMARDCTERPRGADWRNGPPRGRNNNMDRDYESLMQDIGAGGSLTGGQQQMIEAGPGGYNDSSSNRYGGADNRDDLPPWQRGPTGAPAPWSQPSDDPDGNGPAFPPWAAGGNGGGDSYGYPQQSGYNNVPPPPPGSLSWQQPPAPGAQQGYGYGSYSGYDQTSAYGQTVPQAPPGLPPWPQSHPPPPPMEDAPPPPPNEAPPPPPPPGA